MKLTVLVDNNSLMDRYFFAEPGVSYLLEEGDKKILFDVGYSDIFIHNARKMGIDILDVDWVILSHGHLDHSWGLDPLMKLLTEASIEGLEAKRPILLAHPSAFSSRVVKGLGEIGITVSQERLKSQFDLQLSKDAVWLTEKLVFLGEIKRNNKFEGSDTAGYIVGADGLVRDSIIDDTALAYKGHDGLVIITGCSHSGICNIIEQAKRICMEDKVVDVIGGLHLHHQYLTRRDQILGTVDYFGHMDLRSLHACHCTDMASKIALSAVAPLEEVGVGLELEFT